jgi:hypothetical protein
MFIQNLKLPNLQSNLQILKDCTQYMIFFWITQLYTSLSIIGHLSFDLTDRYCYYMYHLTDSDLLKIISQSDVKHIMFFFMVHNATFNNISVISWQSVLLVEETGVPGDNHWPVASHWQTSLHNVVSSTPCHEWGSNLQL